MERQQAVFQFQPADIERLCKTLQCTRSHLAGRLGVSRACVSQWEKGKRVPRRADAMRLRQLLGEQAGAAVDVFELRKKLGMTQRMFGTQFSVSRQQVQKWESGKAAPHRSQLDKLVKLADAAASVGAPLVISPDMLTISGAAAYSGITEKTIRKAVKDGRLIYTVDTSPGPWPRQGRYLIRRSDLETFQTNSYDPYFKKGRWVRATDEQPSPPGSVLTFVGRAFEAPATKREET